MVDDRNDKSHLLGDAALLVHLHVLLGERLQLLDNAEAQHVRSAHFLEFDQAGAEERRNKGEQKHKNSLPSTTH